MMLRCCDTVSLRGDSRLTDFKFLKNNWGGGNYCKTAENFVPLQCQMKEVAEAAVKDKNCEH